MTPQIRIPPALVLVTLAAAVGGGGVAVSTGRSASPAAPPAARRAPAGDATDPDPAPESSGNGAAARRAKRPRDAIAVLERFAGLRAGVDEPSPDDCTRATLAVERTCALGYAKVHVFVATVPDPLDSRFVKLFDDKVSAMRIALERARFVDDRFWDPWRRASEAGGRPPYRSQPGVLLFRRMGTLGGFPNPPATSSDEQSSSSLTRMGDGDGDGDGEARELAVVLLVGETPTRGVHREAMRAALDLAAAVAAAPCGPVPAATSKPAGPPTEAEAVGARAAATLALLGPTMSGTTESLRTTLGTWFDDQGARRPGIPLCGGLAGPPFDLRIVSGSATTDGNRAILGPGLTTRIQRAFPSFRSSFQATVHPDSAREAFVMDYLTRRMAIRRIAILRETSTSYGGGYPKGSASVINLPFPLHISKLRNEYVRTGDADGDGDGGAGAAAISAAIGGRQRLRALEHDGASGGGVEEDAFPAKSRVTQSVSEIALEELLHAISTEDIQAVVIVASSTDDAMFLVRKVRQSFPNVTVVVNDSDLVYLHDDAPFMDGVLVAATYPLLPWSQRLSFPFEGDHTRLLLPSSAAEGTYNAMALLGRGLTHETIVVDYGAPFIVPDRPFRPALWMTLVSRHAIWPLAVAPGDEQTHGGGDGGDDDDASYLRPMQPKRFSAADEQEIQRTMWTVPRSFVFLLANAVLALLDLLLLVAYVRGQRLPRGTARPASGPMDLFLRPKIFRHARMQQLEVAALLLVVFLVNAGFFGVLLVTVLPPAAEVDLPWRLLTIGLGVLAFGVLTATVHAAARFATGRDGRRVAILSVLGVAAASAIGLCLGWQRLAALAEADAQGARIAHLMFFVERARNLDSGVSLLWMVVLLAVGHAMWNLGHLRQARIVEDAAVLRLLGVVPRSGDVPPSPPPAPVGPPQLDKLGLAAPMRAALREAEGVFPSPLGWLLMAAVFAHGLWVSRRLVFFEHPAFGTVCAIAYAVLLALIVFGCTRYIRTWRALEEVLAGVAPLPVIDAFKRVPTRLLTSFKRPWDARVFEVWQRHCRVVFDRLRAGSTPVARWSAALGADEQELQDRLLRPVAAQLEDAERSAPEPTDEQWARAWEDFLAVRLVAFIQYIRAHMANFVAVSTAALLPALWATNFYPLRENRFLLMLVLIVAGATTAVTAFVFVQMNRNYVLSRMNHTSPGRVTWDQPFVSSVLVHVALPLLTILAVKFPELGRGWGVLISTLSALRGG